MATVSPSLQVRLFRFFSGYGLAVTCLLLLLILTWLSTLEQPAKGLYEVQKRYYDAEAWFVLPELDWMPKINGKPVSVPLPGAYLVSAVLFVNLFLGGIIRIRKGWRNIGVVISHFSMVSLLIAGFVSHHYSKEGIMAVYQGDTSDFAQSYTEYTIEVAEIIDGEKTRPYVLPAEYLKSLSADQNRTFQLPELGLDLEVSGWMRNSARVKVDKQDAGEGVQEVDGWALQWLETNPTEELNLAGCHVDVTSKKQGEKSKALILHGGDPNACTVTMDGKIYGLRLMREIWPMPFEVRLDKSIGEYYPGTRKPSTFQSDITRIADGSEQSFRIKMNEPMRYGGFTLYQARWEDRGDRPMSGFAIVKNPSDQWPKYSLYISILGLTIHFGMKLGGFVGKSSQSKSKTKAKDVTSDQATA